MAKEPNSKLDNIYEFIQKSLLNAGIINDKNEILDEKAFLNFIEKREKQLAPKFDATMKEGVVIDQYTFDDIGTELKILEKMRKQKTVTPASESPYPEAQKVEEYFETKNNQKATSKPIGFLKRIFGRDK